MVFGENAFIFDTIYFEFRFEVVVVINGWILIVVWQFWLVVWVKYSRLYFLLV